MRSFLSLLVGLLFAGTAFAENLILANGTIIDGTDKPRYLGSVRIRDGKITDLGVVKPAAGETILDVKGLFVAPGFIDLNSHSAATLEKDPSAASQVSQGITTALLGTDGSGTYDVEKFMMRFDEKPLALNVMTFVGHGTVRRQILGANYKRPATEDEIRRMSELIEDAMRQGAFGLASGLHQEPESYGTKEELIALARAAARYGGVYMATLRDDGERAINSVLEIIDIGRTAKVPVLIPHLKLRATSMRGKAAQVLAEINKARMQGVDVAADVTLSEDDISAQDLRTFVQHPWVAVAGDGGFDTPDPRSAGTFPRLLGYYVREQKVLTLERAIRKMTGFPASRIGLKQRGVLQKGAAADIVVFDSAQVADKSTPQDPSIPPVGIKHVFVNGTMVMKDGRGTVERPGLALR